MPECGACGVGIGMPLEGAPVVPVLGGSPAVQPVVPNVVNIAEGKKCASYLDDIAGTTWKCARALDGDYATFMQVDTGFGADNYITVFFNSSQTIKKIVIYAGEDCDIRNGKITLDSSIISIPDVNANSFIEYTLDRTSATVKYSFDPFSVSGVIDKCGIKEFEVYNASEVSQFITVPGGGITGEAIAPITGYAIEDFFDTDGDDVFSSSLTGTLISEIPSAEYLQEQNVIGIGKGTDNVFNYYEYELPYTPQEGEGVIMLIQNGEDYVGLVVTGYSTEDVIRAADLLASGYQFEPYDIAVIKGTVENPDVNYPTIIGNYPEWLIEEDINGYTYSHSEMSRFGGGTFFVGGGTFYEAYYTDEYANQYGASIENYNLNETTRSTFCSYLESLSDKVYVPAFNIYYSENSYLWYSGNNIVAIGVEEDAAEEGEPSTVTTPIAVMNEYLARYPSDAFAYECDFKGYKYEGPIYTYTTIYNYSRTEHNPESEWGINVSAYRVYYLKDNVRYMSSVFKADSREDAFSYLANAITDNLPTAQFNATTRMYEYVDSGTDEDEMVLMVFAWTHNNYVIAVGFESIPAEKPQMILDKYLWMYPSDATGCLDTDGGMDYSEKGTVINKIFNTNNTDYCKTEMGDSGREEAAAPIIAEYYCEDDTTYVSEYLCQNGCEHGVCLTPEEAQYRVEISAESTYRGTDTVTPATYTITIKNTGTVEDDYRLVVEIPVTITANEPEIIENLAAGETATRTITASSTIPGTYGLFVRAYSQTNAEIASNIITLTLEVTGPYSKSFEFKQGYNLIALPVIPSSTEIRTLFAGIMDKIDAVYGYDASAAPSWLVFYPDESIPQNLVSFEPGKAYWIKMKEDAEITITGTLGIGTPPVVPTIPATAGWNLIGVHSVVPVTMQQYFNNIEGKYTSVWHYNQVIKDLEKVTIAPETFCSLARVTGFIIRQQE